MLYSVTKLILLLSFHTGALSDGSSFIYENKNLKITDGKNKIRASVPVSFIPLCMVSCGTKIFISDSSSGGYLYDMKLKNRKFKLKFTANYCDCHKNKVIYGGKNISVMVLDTDTGKSSKLWEHSSWVSGVGYLGSNPVSCSWDHSCVTLSSGNIKRKKFRYAVNTMAVGHYGLIVNTDNGRLHLFSDELKRITFKSVKTVFSKITSHSKNGNFGALDSTGKVYLYKISAKNTIEKTGVYQDKSKKVNDIQLNDGKIKYIFMQ
ncbi:MAG: hypothetical protein JXR95_04990 [Deltaproteobacteria bacterium]|nr:hypothetical protein [Deltaproteobacteria bacterium]